MSPDPITALENPVGAFHRYRYAEANPFTNSDPDGRECNGRGCWVTPQERAAARSGNYKEYYRLAGQGGDAYATRAGEVATMSGRDAESTALSIGTNARLAGSIYGNLPDSMAPAERVLATVGAMESIRVDLANAHVDALAGGDV